MLLIIKYCVLIFILYLLIFEVFYKFIILKCLFKKNNTVSYEYLRKPLNRVSNNYYMNYGLWLNENDTLATANKNLIGYISTLILNNLSPEAHHNIFILDVGCGYGEQDMDCMKHLEKKIKNIYIEAIDIGKPQIDFAIENRAKNQISEKNLIFKVGDATELQNVYKPAQFDVLLSIETAFHYKNRNDFFKSISPILKPNGLFIICDIVLSQPLALIKTNFRKHFILNRFIDALDIPQVNLIDANEFKENLEEHFEIVEFNNMTNKVFTPFYTYFWRAYLKSYHMPDYVIKIITNLFIHHQPFNYVFAVCKKKV